MRVPHRWHQVKQTVLFCEMDLPECLHVHFAGAAAHDEEVEAVCPGERGRAQVIPLQNKWKIIARPSNFMTVETMSTIMICVILLHKICVEERMELNMPEEEEEIYADDIIIGGGVTPMWGGLLRMSGREIVSDSTGSIDSVCEAENFLEDEAKHNMKKRLLIKRIWDK